MRDGDDVQAAFDEQCDSADRSRELCDIFGFDAGGTHAARRDRSLQNPAAEREIRVVLKSVNCKTTIHLHINKYEFITGEVRLSVQAPGGPEHRRFGLARPAGSAIFVC